MKSSIQKVYEAPKAEVIEIEYQGILCASADPTGGKGFQFDIDDGGW